MSAGNWSAQAKKQKTAVWFTTTKDLARLKGMGKEQEKLLEASIPLHAELKPEDPAMLDRVVNEAIASLEKRRLKNALSSS